MACFVRASQVAETKRGPALWLCRICFCLVLTENVKLVYKTVRAKSHSQSGSGRPRGPVSVPTLAKANQVLISAIWSVKWCLVGVLVCVSLINTKLSVFVVTGHVDIFCDVPVYLRPIFSINYLSFPNDV